MIRSVDRRAGAQQRDSGLGLVELLAASFISLLMLTLVGTMFMQVTKLTTSAQSTKNATGIAWTALNELSGVVRQATQVPVSATAAEGGVIAGSTPTKLILDALDNATVSPGQAAIVPSRVTFSVDASGNLIEQRIPGALTNGFYTFAGAASSRAVNGPIVTSGAGTNAPFVYYSGTGSTLTAIAPASTGLTSAQAAQVTTVGINVVVSNTVSTIGSDPVQLTNLVTMPNIAIVNGGN